MRWSALVLLVPATFATQGAGIHPSSSGMTRLLAETVLKSDFGFWLTIRLARPMVIENVLGTPYHIAKSANPFERERLQTMLMSILPVSRRRRDSLMTRPLYQACDPST